MKKIAIFSEASNGPRLARVARRLGYKPYLFFPSEPRVKTTDNYVVIDGNQTLESLEEKITDFMGKPDAVACCIEQFNVNIGRYAHKHGLSDNDVNFYEILRDKTLMKKRWQEKNVSTPKSIIGDKIETLNLETLNYPMIIKPSLGAASVGVKIVEDQRALIKQIKMIQRFNATTLGAEKVTTPKFIIEEYIEGDEYSVDTIWHKGRPLVTGIMYKGNPKGPIFPDRLYMTHPLEEKIIQLASEAVLAVGDVTGPTHTEIRFKNNKGYVIESALRPGAGGAFYPLFNKRYGVDFDEQFMLSMTSEDQQLLPVKSDGGCDHEYYWYNLGYNKSGVIKSISGKEEILACDSVLDLQMKKDVGDYLPRECDSYSYLAWLTGIFDKKISFETCMLTLQMIESKLIVEV